MDPVARNNAKGRRTHGFISLHVDDLFMAGDKVFESKVFSSLRKNFAVGSEDKNDIMFVGQRITWKTHEKYGSYVSVDQKLAVDAVEEVKIDKTLKDNVQCNSQLHTAYPSVLGPQLRLVRQSEMYGKLTRLFVPWRVSMLLTFLATERTTTYSWYAGCILPK